MLMEIVSVLVPVLVAITTTLGAIAVAKMKRMQTYMTTNHGTTGLGNAMDRVLDEVEKISEQQSEIILAIDSLRSRDAATETRVTELERNRSRVMKHLGLSPSAKKVKTITERPKRRWFL